ncbi:N-acetylmuramoyl-L-alanine amidase [Planomicrobium soli]|uniref:N-acetylmuramoyl-L-alanine amidase n=1 Tax=Planomicrobium soli TaxID=1176648 RepID=A0A2P8H7B4_9BACL|nr:N-acetylmuramoyl-L-alanine amidase [Planomicrobium soli]PSL42117.1 N-acetylmuramoyl-L-alanine amidase [Planomicrobium soli]
MRFLPHGMKIGHATVIVDIVPKGNPKIRPGIPMKARGITDHDTGNPGRGADAKAHNKLLHNWGKLPVKDTTHISWHGALDEDFIIQHLPFDEPAYHCGDGWGLNSGNRNTIGFEKCMHQGADRQKIEENAIALYAYLMKEMNLPIEWVRPHQYWSGKYCPQLILNKYGTFKPFRDKIEAEFKRTKVKVAQVSKDYWMNGDKGKPIEIIQDMINFLGYNPNLTVDGIFGNGTEAGVRWFQKKFNLVIDGIAGKATLSKLTAEVNAVKKVEVDKKAAEEAKKAAVAKPKAPVYRVSVEGKQVNAYSQLTGMVQELEKAIKSGKKNIEYKQV